jgi:hypothetical protein
MPATLTDLLLALAAGSVVVLAAVAFALYLWTWLRYVAPPQLAGRGGRRQDRPCAGCPAVA